MQHVAYSTASNAEATKSTSTPPNIRSPLKGIRAHGKIGELTSLMLPEFLKAAERSHALTLPELVLTPRQLCDIECLLNGAFTPLTGFMTEEEYH
jgi:hypothetical protein